MISSRWRAVSASSTGHDQAADSRRLAARTPRRRARSRRRSRTSIGLNSTPTDGATAWIDAELADSGGSWRHPEAPPRASRPARSRLSSSSHFPPRLYSNWVKPVALPPGRARLSTKPAPTGSATCTNTIGTVRVACSNGPSDAGAGGQDDVRRERDQFGRMFAHDRRLALAPANNRSAGCGRRSSPSCLHALCRKSSYGLCASGSLACDAERRATPTRRTRSCARAASGQNRSAAAPPSSRDELAPLHSITSSARASTSAARRGRAPWRS